MLDSITFDAILKDAYIRDVSDFEGGKHKIVSGDVYSDRKGRFPDGKHVTTTPIVEGPDENNIIVTRSGTRYKLELAPEQNPQVTVLGPLND